MTVLAKLSTKNQHPGHWGKNFKVRIEIGICDLERLSAYMESTRIKNTRLSPHTGAWTEPDPWVSRVNDACHASMKTAHEAARKRAISNC